MTNNWYSIQAKADSAEVRIYDEIGAWGTTAKAFAEELSGIKAKIIDLHLNTPGGDVFDGFAIYNTLKSHGATINVHIDGLAASMGSIIAMAGDTINIAKNGYLMIHNPWSFALGDAAEMRKQADLMDKLAGTMAETYASRAGGRPEKMRAIMDAETWYNAEDAKAAGLVDAITGEDGDMPSQAAKALKKFGKLPDPLRRIAAMYIEKTGPNDPPAPVGTGAKAAKMETPMNLETFKAFAAEHPDAVASYIESGKKTGIAEAHTSEIARAKAIREACGGNDGLALDTFLAGKSADEAKATIDAVAKAKADADATIKAQAAEIEKLKAQVGTQGPIGGLPAKKDEPEPAAADDTDAQAKAQAEQEWDAKAAGTTAFKSKENYVYFRVQVLTGKHVA